MNYKEKLIRGTEISGSIVCMGLDPVIEHLPGGGPEIKENIVSFFKALFREMAKERVLPGAFKPNIGFYHCLDRPREGQFHGSEALSGVLDMIDEFFPGIPVILDYKRGDIVRSSRNYAVEGFSAWGCDAVTVAPYMGSDSVFPFLEEAQSGGNGVYILNRTSNPGAAELQDLPMEKGGLPLYMKTAEKIAGWAEQFPGTGAVVGATSLPELEAVSGYYVSREIPLLIPGVGGQGGDAGEVAAVLKKNSYPLRLVRINSSSGITHPWVKEKKRCPVNWPEICTASLKTLNDAIGVPL